MLKELSLIWTTHPNKIYLGRQYLDFIISGQPLREYLEEKNNSNVTPFGFFSNVEEQKRALRELKFQQKTQLKENRVELYICEDCGDIGCGSITTEIKDLRDKIIWKNFAFQNNLDEIGQLINVDQLEFDRQNYFKTFSMVV